VKTLYDSEIRHTDERLAEVLRLLRVTDDDLVIFTSDHGEEFGEHGLFQHGRSLNEASVRIPLIVRYPRRELAGQTSAAPVSIMDVFPTILQVVGSPAPSGLDGTTLSAAQRVDPENPTPILLELFRRDQHLRALVLAPWKLIVDLKRPAQPRLFDLRQEPISPLPRPRPSFVCRTCSQTILQRRRADPRRKRSRPSPRSRSTNSAPWATCSDEERDGVFSRPAVDATAARCWIDRGIAAAMTSNAE